MTPLFDHLLRLYTEKYLEVLSRLKNTGRRSYGFEYEFLPTRILTPADVSAVSRLLASEGFLKDKDVLYADNGLGVAFEPGGQIEYASPPLFADDMQRFDDLLVAVQTTNALIRRHLGIDFIAVDFMPHRKDAPLCLTSERYVKLHQRLSTVDRRGLEMMKGTASIHLHVVISGIDEILPLFRVLCRLSRTDGFKMSPMRRDIWMQTDSCRCGLPPCCSEILPSSEILIRRLVNFALHADVLGEDVPFAVSSDVSFDAFLRHMTTLFTDVRFNLKGPTLELRTMDSMPVEWFCHRWHDFVLRLEAV